MVDIIKKSVEKVDIEEFIRKLVNDEICEEIKKKT
jgi:ribosomal protein S3AE